MSSSDCSPAVLAFHHAGGVGVLVDGRSADGDALVGSVSWIDVIFVESMF